MPKYLFSLFFSCFLLFFSAEDRTNIFLRWQSFLYNTEKKDSVITVPSKYLPLLIREKTVRSPRRRIQVRESVPSGDKTSDERDNPDRALPKPKVGTIPIEISVSPTGARCYSVPIITTEGLKLTPTISLQYNSQGGYGVCGFGWDIAGISKITVINKNLYYHGIIAPAKCGPPSAGAAYALDGVPLVTNVGPLNTTYPLVTASGNILVSLILSGQCVTGFHVLYPDGKKAEYGVASSSNEVTYPIVSLEDIDGNRITYEYLNKGTSTGNQYIISKVNYGIRGSQAALAEIEFEYLSNQPYHTTYYAGAILDNRACLNSISSKCGGELLCKYDMSYDENDETSFLTKIICRKQTSAEKLNPLKFSYYYSEQSPVQERLFCRDSLGFYSYFDTDDLCLARGRFFTEHCNDGFISYPNFNTYWIKQSYWGYHKYDSQFDPDQTLLVYPVADYFLCPSDTLHAGQGFQGLFAADVNGDGKDELIKLGYAGVNGDKTKLRVSTYYVNSFYGGHNLLNSSVVEVDGKVQEGPFTSPLWRHFLIGDFLGTGKSQLMTISFDKTPSGGTRTSYCDLISLDTGVRISGFTCPFSVASDGSMPVAVDLDGDGKTEIVKYGNHTLDFYQLVSNSQMSLLYSSSYNASLTEDLFSDAKYSDLNGDGYLDILIRTTGTNWLVIQNTGNACVVETRTFGSNRTDSSFMFFDVDKNGFADLVEIESDGKMYSYININGIISSSAIVGNCKVGVITNILPANITHYGNASAFVEVNRDYVKIFDYTVNRGSRRLLTGMVDGYGKKQYNAYELLSDDGMGGCYSVYQSSPLPLGYRLLADNIYLLAQEETYMGETGSEPYFSCHFYSYIDAVMNTEGLGFIGFNKTVTYDLQGNGIHTWNDTQMMGVPVKRTYFTRLHRVGKDSLIYDANVDTYKKMNPLLKKSFHTDILSGTVVEKTFSYSDFDYPHTIQTRWLNGNTVDASLFEAFQYDHKTTDAACYLLGSITQEDHNLNQDNDFLTIYAKKTTLSYDALMHPVEVFEHLRDTGELSIPPVLLSHRVLSYDSYGDILSDKTSQFGETKYLGNTMTYDAYGRTASITDPLGHTTTVNSYNVFGKPLSVTDYKNRQTSWTYDNFGRFASCTSPDGTVESHSLTTGGVGKYIVTTTKTGEPERKTHYDAAGRELRSSVTNHNGDNVIIDKEYDEFGRLFRVSFPRVETDTTRIWNTFSYDTLNRLSRYQEASGKITTWSYNGLSSSETKEGITRTITKDAAGNVVSVTDPGGTITFTLRDDGQPSSITSPGNVIRTFGYDHYGRQTTLVDPSLGTRTVSRSSRFGCRHDRYSGPNGSYFVNYDTLGRKVALMRPVFDAPSVTYQYNTDGLLSSATSDNGASETYTYDSYDRIATAIFTADNGYSFMKEFTYGPGSKIASIKYTEIGQGEICTENYTYAFGHQTKTSLSGGTTVYELLSKNAFGYPTSVKTGTATRVYTYSNYGVPTGRQTGAAIGETYSFNTATGNLMQWSDTLAGTTTTYGYDSLNRLNVTDSDVLEYNTYGSRSMYHTPGGSLYPNLGYDDANDPYKLTTYYIRPISPPLSYPRHTITYNTADRPATISSQGGTIAALKYNGEGDRVSMTVSRNDTTFLTKTYLAGQYEIESNDTTTIRRLYLGGDYYSAPAVLVKNGNGSWTFYNIIRDYLGSVRCLAAIDGAPLETCSYGAWGGITAGGLPSIGRGYTGHEHLPWFGFINMNARLYDPNVGRFLSADPYVQAPFSTQNYNRYAYALNNPLKYTDESGELLGLVLLLLGNDPILCGIGNLIAHSVNNESLGGGKWAKYLGQGMLAGLIGTHIEGSMMAAAGTPGLVGMAGGAMLTLSKTFWASQGAITDISMFFSLGNDGGFERGAQIWLGNFYLDENASFGEGMIQGALRRTWEGAQTALGYSLSQLRNAFGDVTRVDYLGGATFITAEENGREDSWGVTLGNFINIDYSGKITENFDVFIKTAPLFMHEYGHTIDSRKWGPLFLYGVGLPSLISASNSTDVPGENYSTHDLKSYERSANRNAKNYFYNNYQVSWTDFESEYPL